MQDIRAVLAARVRELRLAAGLSQEALAAAAGEMTRAYVSEIEAGKRLASVRTVERLARALGVEPSALLKGAAVTKRNPRPVKETAANKLGKAVAKLAEGASEKKIRAFEVVAKAFFRP